jgi:broad specificity phosphatase PhoE
MNDPSSGRGQILLARHGETNDNREPLRFQGFTDTPLNGNGLRQAAELAVQIGERTGSERVRSLWSSDLSRAHRTALIVGERVGLRPRLDPRLREGARGRWEGRLMIDVQREEPQLFAAWRRGGADFRFPGGESLQDQQDRVQAAVEEIRAGAELPALVVCHGGAIRAMLALSDPRGLDAFHTFTVPNVGVFPL